MPRRRISILAALVVAVSALAGLGPARGWTSWTLPDGQAASPSLPVDHLLLSEVMTGGASASDEFIEIYNPSGVVLPLEGLEVVYVSASGATITRKAAWDAGAAEVPPGAHVLLANEAGAHASIADGLYAGGLAATGGSVALRIQGAAAAIDALGWGTAASSWLEGVPAAAAAAGSSLERLPGGAEGSGQDTDDNATDFVQRAGPDPQNSGSPPIPVSSPAPSSSGSPTATPPPTPTATATATATPAATPSPTPAGSPAPTSPVSISIAAARALPDGARATVEGTALTEGAFTDGGGYLQDASGGIAVLVSGGSYPRGALLQVTGLIDDRYHQRTLRADAADVVLLGTGTDPAATAASTGDIGEQQEGTLQRIEATITSSATQLSNGVAFDVDDGSGPARLVIYASTGIDTSALSRGLVIAATGVVGQRDSSGTGTAGYRFQPRDLDDVISIGPPATPQPSGSPGATPSGSAGPSMSPEPDGTISIAAARQSSVNRNVRVRGVVTLPSSVLGDGTAAIQDATGGIILRLGDEAGGVQLGEVLLVTGKRSTKSGMETVHASSPPDRIAGGSQPLALARSTGGLGEADEALLVVVRGAITTAPRRTSADNVYFDLDDGSGPARVFISPRTGIDTRGFAQGAWLEVRGVLGQETSGQQPLRGYRLWPRIPADIRLISAAGGESDGAGSAPVPDAGQTDPGGASVAVGGPGGAAAGVSGAVVDLPRPRLVPPRLAGPTPPQTGRPQPSPTGAPSGGEVGSTTRSALGLALLLVTVLAAIGGVAARSPGLAERLRASVDRLTRREPVEAEQIGPEPGPAPPRLVPLHAVDDRRASTTPSALSTIRDHDGRILPPT